MGEPICDTTRIKVDIPTQAMFEVRRPSTRHVLCGGAGDGELSGADGDARLIGGTGVHRLSGASGVDSCNADGQAGDFSSPSPDCDTVT